MLRLLEIHKTSRGALAGAVLPTAKLTLAPSVGRSGKSWMLGEKPCPLQFFLSAGTQPNSRR